MEKLFLTVLNMSVTACYLILFVLLVRLLLRRLPKRYSCLLWLPVFFRMACPVTFSSDISLIGALTGKTAQPAAAVAFIPQEIGMMAQPAVDVGSAQVSALINQALPAATPAASANPMQLWIAVGATVWLVGLCALAVYAAASYLRLRYRLATATRLRDNIYETDRYDVPFVAGLFPPRIYLPVGFDLAAGTHILLHERLHIRRGDYIVKPLAFLILTAHWFNPLAWLAYLLLCRDMEMSCDERVLETLGNEVRTAYSRSLLSAATHQFGLGLPLAFGESDTKARVKNALQYSKPARWLALLAGVLTLLTVISCASDKKEGFTPERAIAWASTFSTEETDRAKIGALAYSRYLDAFMEEDVPEEYRIDSYEIVSAALYSESTDEFAVQIVSDYSCRSTYWLSANGSFIPRADGSGYDCKEDTCYVYLRALGGGKYELYDKGTGGNFPGEPVDSDVARTTRLMAEIYHTAEAIRSTAQQMTFTTFDIPELQPYNFGSITLGEDGVLAVQLQWITGLEYVAYPDLDAGCSSGGPWLEYTVRLSDGALLSRSVRPAPAEGYSADTACTYVEVYPAEPPLDQIGDARLCEIAQTLYQRMLALEITPETEPVPEMHLAVSGKNELYFAHVNFVPEFSLYNEGGARYDPATNRITVSVTVSTGTSTGALEGPRCALTVDLTGSGSLVSRSYEPEPTGTLFRHTRDYDGSFQTATDARLVEIGKMFYSILQSGGTVVFNETATASDGITVYDLTDLDAAVDWAILQHNRGSYYAGEYAVAAHRTFDAVVEGDQAVVCLQFAYAEMGFEHDRFVAVSGGAGPARITLKKNAAGGYVSAEYLEPTKDPKAQFTEKAYAAYQKQGDIDALYTQMEAACRAYLKAIGRTAEVSLHPADTAPQSDAVSYRWPLADGAGRYNGSLDVPGAMGMDIAAPKGATVVAAADGIVSVAQTDILWPYGRSVELVHADGTTTRYAHLDTVAVASGDRVTSGQAIGTVGATGNASAAALLFELYAANGHRLDPRTAIGTAPAAQN